MLTIPGNATHHGRSCRTCRKWDGHCTDRRHSNDDPDRPCLLYRYREQQAVSPEPDEPMGYRVCAKCRKPRPLDWFVAFGGKRQTVQCRACREKMNDAYRKRVLERMRKKEEE